MKSVGCSISEEVIFHSIHFSFLIAMSLRRKLCYLWMKNRPPKRSESISAESLSSHTTQLLTFSRGKSLFDLIWPFSYTFTRHIFIIFQYLVWRQEHYARQTLHQQLYQHALLKKSLQTPLFLFSNQSKMKLKSKECLKLISDLLFAIQDSSNGLKIMLIQEWS